MNEHIYLDHAATTPLHPEVLKTYTETLENDFGNSGSLHSFGRSAYGLLEQSRNVLADVIHAKPNEIIFTSGGTESDNTAILQTAYARKHVGKHLITTAIEHSAVLKPMAFLETEGFEVTYLEPDQTGMISLDQVKEAVREDTILVSLMYGNNEVGTKLPIKEVGNYLKENHPQVIFHTDAVQAFGMEDINVVEEGIDLLSSSSHKLNGPKGVGLLFMREGIALPSFMKGGDQELKRRAGTVNVPGIVGYKKAVEVLIKERQQRKERNEQLRNATIKGLKDANISFEINGNEEHRLSHVLSIWLKNVPSERLLTQLDLAGLAVAAGSACSAGNPEPSHVLEAIYGKDHPAVTDSIRISFGLGNKEEDIEKLIASITRAASRYQS